MINVTVTEVKKEECTPGKTKVKQYSFLMKLALVILILYTLWVAVIIVSIYYLNLGYRWSILSMEEWFIVGCVLFAFIIILEVICITRVAPSRKKEEASKKLMVEKKVVEGKNIWVYTHPEGVKGGVFSKTYVPVDDENYLELRIQIKNQDMM